VPAQTIYTERLAQEICYRIAEGQSLRRIAEDPEMPARITIWDWVIKDREGFASMFHEARQVQAEGFIDEILEIADDRSGDTMRDRLRVDTRKWYASKIIPRIYGERQIHQTQDEDGELRPLNIGLINVPPKIPDAD